jgi:hypothetical protein
MLALDQIGYIGGNWRQRWERTGDNRYRPDLTGEQSIKCLMVFLQSGAALHDPETTTVSAG